MSETVYTIREYRPDSYDTLKATIPGDVESLDPWFEWAEANAPNKFSAAYSRPEYMEEREWYLTKEHGVKADTQAGGGE